jgi:predicted P-loop ATPase
VLVLCGPQGAGKSRLAQALAVRPDWYHESAVTLGDKDAYLATLGPWVFEIAELAGMRRTDQEKVKAFVSEKESKFRAPYGRVQETHPRRLVFIATTNDEEYGRDATGARRWLDVAVTGEMRIPTESEIRQLWAEAVVCYQRGDRRYETAEEMAETNQRGEGRREIDPVEIAATEEVRGLAREGAVTVGEVLDRLRSRQVQVGVSGSRAVTTALRAAKWTRHQIRVGDTRPWVWVAPGVGLDAAKEAVRRQGFQREDN